MVIKRFYGGMVKMGVLDFNRDDTLGTVESVDTSTVVIRVDSDEKIKGLQVNHLLSIQSPRVGQQLIGMVSKIIRKSTDSDDILDWTALQKCYLTCEEDNLDFVFFDAEPITSSGKNENIPNYNRKKYIN